MLMARAVARPRATRAAAPAADPSHTEVAARVETPRVERSKVEPVKAEPAKVETKSESAKSDVAPELRRSTD